MSDATHSGTRIPKSSHNVRTSEHDSTSGHSKSSYGKFFAMIGTSTAIMFALMYFNTCKWTHLFRSEMRFYLVSVMGAAIAIVMLTFMLGMYKSKTANIAIYVGSA